jgi:hypothetical protein
MRRPRTCSAAVAPTHRQGDFPDIGESGLQLDGVIERVDAGVHSLGLHARQDALART